MNQALPETGFIRLDDILRFIPISKASWWAGVKTGRYPTGVKISPRCTAWKVEDIRATIERLGRAEG